jgi:predicted phosphodiesterase
VRIIITADLHYDIERSQTPTRELAERVCGMEADALLLLGDVAGRETQIVSDCLHLFDGFRGAKFFVAGNHDIWCLPGESSLERLESTLPRLCREAGFHPLDIEPAEIDGVGIVGSMGWYDYTFLPDGLGIPLRFYQAKVAPGAAERLPGYESLVAQRNDVADWAWELGIRWMDGEHVRLPMSDEALCDRLLARLASHLDWASRTCRPIVVGLHHVPFRELVPLFSTDPAAMELQHDPKWAFTAPYMGSRRLGELLLQHPNVAHVYCGHTHFPARTRQHHLQCINVGCTYAQKRLEVLDI